MTYVKDYAIFFDLKNYTSVVDYRKLFQKIHNKFDQYDKGNFITDIPVVYEPTHVPVLNFVTEQPEQVQKLYDFITTTQGWDTTDLVVIYYTSTTKLTDFFKIVLQKFATRYNIEKIVLVDEEQLETRLKDIFSNNPNTALSLNELNAQELLEDARIEEIEAQNTITLEDLEQEGKVKYIDDKDKDKDIDKKERLLILLEYLQDQIDSLRNEINELK